MEATHTSTNIASCAGDTNTCITCNETFATVDLLVKHIMETCVGNYDVTELEIEASNVVLDSANLER